MPYKDKEEGRRHQIKYRLEHPNKDKEYYRTHKTEIRENEHQRRIKIIQLIGDRCIFCDLTERLIFHEIHGLTHRYTPKYYREHPQDFITLCLKHHKAVHEISQYPEIFNYRIKPIVQ